MKPLKIGNIEIKNRLFLAPMVDVTDLPYRLLCKKAGAGIVYTEMINIGSILNPNPKTLNMMKTISKEKPVGIQITGRTVEEFEKVIPYLKKANFDLVDINCGCPSSRIVGNASGSYLMRDLDVIEGAVKVLKKAGFIVTVKCRLGFKKINVIEFAKTVEKAGASLITVHARLASDTNKTPADWSYFSKIKKEVKIPVIANGDIDSGEKVKELLKVCDGVMIARPAIGNPLIFKQILDYLDTGEEKPPEFSERIKLFKEYLELAEKYNVVEIGRVKYLGSSFLKRFKGASKKREEFMRLKTYEEMKEFINKVLEARN